MRAGLHSDLRATHLSFLLWSSAAADGHPQHEHRRVPRCGVSVRYQYRRFSSAATIAVSSTSGSSSSGESSSVSPGLLQLPGVHTPDQLLQLARASIQDCQALLESEAAGNNPEDAKRTLHVLDAVSNALCKVADAAELIR